MYCTRLGLVICSHNWSIIISIIKIIKSLNLVANGTQRILTQQFWTYLFFSIIFIILDWQWEQMISPISRHLDRLIHKFLMMSASKENVHFKRNKTISLTYFISPIRLISIAYVQKGVGKLVTYFLDCILTRKVALRSFLSCEMGENICK